MRFYDMFTGEVRDTAKKNKGSCRCKHPTFSNGRCHYRTCNHDTTTHYRVSYQELPHNKDQLEEDEERLFPEALLVMIRKDPKYNEVKELINWIKKGIAKCSCGFVVRQEDLRYYPDHDNGLLIPYEEKPVWIYSHCAKCGNDYNYQKILRQKSWYEMRQTQ